MILLNKNASIVLTAFNQTWTERQSDHKVKELRIAAVSNTWER